MSIFFGKYGERFLWGSGLFCKQKVETNLVVNWAAIIGVILGAVIANTVNWSIASINGVVVASACYLVGIALKNKVSILGIIITCLN